MEVIPKSIKKHLSKKYAKVLEAITKFLIQKARTQFLIRYLRLIWDKNDLYESLD